MKFTIAEDEQIDNWEARVRANQRTADDFQVGDWVTFMNSRGWDITGELVKKFETKARVKDEQTGEMFMAYYGQMVKLDKPTQATRNTNKLMNVLKPNE